MPEQTKPKQQYKVYTLKLFNIMLSFRRKTKDTRKPIPRRALLQGERYQAMWFGYDKLGFMSHFMTAGAISKYMEQMYNKQSPENKKRFARYMERSKRIKEKMVSKVKGGIIPTVKSDVLARNTSESMVTNTEYEKMEKMASKAVENGK